MDAPNKFLSKIKPTREITAKSLNRIVMDNLSMVIEKLASSKTEEETGVLQELALELVKIQEMQVPGEKLRAFEAIASKLPESCGCK